MHRYQATHVYTVCYAHARNAVRTRLTVNLQSFSSCRDRVRCGLLRFTKSWFIPRASFALEFSPSSSSRRPVDPPRRSSRRQAACSRSSLDSSTSTPSCFASSCKCSCTRTIASCRSSCCEEGEKHRERKGDKAFEVSKRAKRMCIFRSMDLTLRDYRERASNDCDKRASVSSVPFRSNPVFSEIDTDLHGARRF